jgi:hypothetical protein
MKERMLTALLLVVVVFGFIAWTNQPKDGHNVSTYTLTMAELAFSGGSPEVFPVVCEKIIVKALDGNGAVLAYLGGATVASDGSNGYELGAGDSVTIESYMTATTLYVIGDGSGQVCYMCFN